LRLSITKFALRGQVALKLAMEKSWRPAALISSVAESLHERVKVEIHVDVLDQWTPRSSGAV